MAHATATPWRSVGVVLAAAGCGALVLGLAAGLWGRTPAGNTALVVPFAGGPALVAASWIVLALILQQRETNQRTIATAAALGGLLALLTSAAVIFLPILTAGSTPQQPEPSYFPLGLVGPLLAASIGGALLARNLLHEQPAWALLAVATILAAAAQGLLPGAGYLVAPFLLPLLIALPILARTHRAATALTCLAALLVVVIGLMAGTYVSALLPPT